MKRIIFLLGIMVTIVITSCNNQPSDNNKSNEIKHNGMEMKDMKMDSMRMHDMKTDSAGYNQQNTDSESKK